jgi:hypothetical protein
MRPGKSDHWYVVVSHEGIFVCLYRQNRLQYPSCPSMKISVNGASTILGHVSWGITPPIGCSQSYRNFWLHLYSKQIAIPSLRYHENERQWSVNDCWSGIVGNLGGHRLHIVINWLLAAFIGKSEIETLPDPSSKWASAECQWLLAFHHG